MRFIAKIIFVSVFAFKSRNSGVVKNNAGSIIFPKIAVRSAVSVPI